MLERNGLIERRIYGFSQYGSKEICLKGKALYDTLALTRLGTSYLLGTLGVTEQAKRLHSYYAKNNTHTDVNMQERFKRLVLTDVMFRRDLFIRVLLGTDFLNNATREVLQNELNSINKKIYNDETYSFVYVSCKYLDSKVTIY